jgi:rsbT co-antagonist protein RsbR
LQGECPQKLPKHSTTQLSITETTLNRLALELESTHDYATIGIGARKRLRRDEPFYALLFAEEPVSLSIFPPNGHTAPVSFAPFRAYLEAERPALINTLAREIMRQIPEYGALADDAPEQRIEQNIGIYLASLDDSEALVTWTKQQFDAQMHQNLELDTIFEISSVYRQQFLKVALRALADGVEDAEEGLSRLMELVDLRVRLFAQFYQDRLRLFETLVNNSPDGIGVSSLDGKQMYPNPAFRTLLGYGDELIGMHFNDYLQDSDPAVMQELMEHGFWQGTNIYRRKDGSTLRAHSTIFIITDTSGQPIALGGVIRDISGQLSAAEELSRQASELQTFYALAENAPDGVLVASIEGTISYANTAIRTLLGFDNDSMAELQVLDRLDAPPELLEQIGVEISTNGSWRGALNYRRRDGSIVPCQASSFLIQSGDSAVIASIVRDLTSQQLAEQERMALQDQVIAAQQAALRELSTPLIPLADHVVAMPLIGSVDSARAQQIVEELLAGVAANRATTAIIDITGVPIVDTQVAGALLRAAQAVELLGSRVVLTGIRPEVAQTLVGIGVNLGSIVTRATLQDGIAYALRKITS